MTRALIFPGQGSQFVGMGKTLADALPAARETFEEVDDALGSRLSRVMFEGPEDALRLTENTQPALMAVSMAIIRTLESGGAEVSAIASHVAGHSLGEYSALCAAGSMTLADTARLLRLRGQAMQRAVPVGNGAMAALLGLDFDDAEAVAEEAAGPGEICATANDNAPGQVVLSGTKAAVERAIEIARDRGARKGVLLPVSAPFHCALMKPAAEDMRAALADVPIARPARPLLANVTATAVEDPEQIRELLVEQITAMVRWRETVGEMRGLGIDQVVEIGAGKVLSGLVRRIDRDLEITNVQDPADLDAFASSL